MNYIIHHSLRTLLKKGDEDALAFLGYEKHPPISLYKLKLHEKTVLIGE